MFVNRQDRQGKARQSKKPSLNTTSAASVELTTAQPQLAFFGNPPTKSSRPTRPYNKGCTDSVQSRTLALMNSRNRYTTIKSILPGDPFPVYPGNQLLIVVNNYSQFGSEIDKIRCYHPIFWYVLAPSLTFGGVSAPLRQVI